MTKVEMAKTVLAMVVRFREHALLEYIDQVGKLAAVTASSSLWKENEDNVFSRNPYNVELTQKRLVAAKAELDRCDAIVEFVTHTFIESLPNEA